MGIMKYKCQIFHILMRLEFEDLNSAILLVKNCSFVCLFFYPVEIFRVRRMKELPVAYVYAKVSSCLINNNEKIL